LAFLFLVDFDGTVTEVDTVEAMVRKFARGDWRGMNKLWEEKLISTAEVARRVFATFDAEEEQIKTFVGSMKIDPHFAPFVSEVEGRNDRLYIVSDGYDYLIQAILRREGLERIPYFANHMYINGREFSMDPGGVRSDCGKCGTCKRDVIDSLRQPGETVVLAGDSYSDFCASEYADVVFAKSHLLTYCTKNDIPCLAYTDFADILAWYRDQSEEMAGQQSLDVE
jgi:2-hydroxy-3-keto-5-methylthiopentenyl-1-phosphate phosphatase